MRLLAEERKSGTIELLLTMPIRDSHVVLGKFAAAVLIVAIGLALTLPYAVSVASLTAPNSQFDWGPAIGGYIGLLLMAASFIALGLWASSLSRNQIVGFIIGSLLCFAFYIIDRTAIFLPASLGTCLSFLSGLPFSQYCARRLRYPRHHFLFFLNGCWFVVDHTNFSQLWQ